MNKLSFELYLLIFEYLRGEDQRELGNCCQWLYHEVMRPHIRVLTVNMRKWSSFEKSKELINRLPGIIKYPSKQLIIFAQTHYSARTPAYFVLELLQAVNYSCQGLFSPFQVLYESLQHSSLQITCYGETTSFEIQYANSPWKDYATGLQWMRSLEKLSLVVNNRDFSLPEIPNLRELTLSRLLSATSLQSLPTTSFSRLRSLELSECKIFDVSMFGSIPELTLLSCGNIRDISALQNNHKITIHLCAGISDYSRSFTNSEKIDLMISSSLNAATLSCRQWKQVKSLKLDLNLTTSLESESAEVLWEDAFSSNSLLREFILVDDNTITSLVTLGVDQLVVIELYRLHKLSSLQGLGAGRNQKVIIRDCPLITDYSPLRYVHEVKIINSKGVVHLDQLDHVKILTIDARELVIDPSNVYDHIQELAILGDTICHHFQPLRVIPSLTIGYHRHSFFLSLFEAGIKMENQKLMVQYCHDGHREAALFICQSYFASDYTLSEKNKQIILLRKSLQLTA